MVKLALPAELIEKLQQTASSRQQSIAEYLESVVEMTQQDENSLPITLDSPTNGNVLNSLHHNENQYNQLIEAAPVAVMIVDDEGHIRFVNAGAENLFKYQRHELIGQVVEILLPQQFQNIHIAHRSSFFDHPETRAMGANLELAGRRKDGTEFPVEIGLSYIRAEDEILALAFITDITERKHAHDVVRRSEARFRHLVETAPGAIVVVNKDGTIELVNESVEILFGYQRANLVGQAIEILLPQQLRDIHAHQRSSFFDHPEARAMGANLELAGRRNDGTEFPVEIGLSYIRAEDEILALAFITDITERKRAQQQQLTLQIEQERVKILRTFIQDAAHEFRTPLTVMRTNLYLAKNTPDETKKDKFVNRIEQKIEDIEKLVDDLSIIARLDTLPNYVLTPHKLNDLLTAFAKQYHPRIQTAGLSMVVELAEPTDEVMLHPTDFKKALDHIVDNAIRFAKAHDRVTIQSIYHNEQVTIIIEDTGMGMSAEVQARIFEHFYREDAAHSTYGFGLGLPIARKIIELHHGTITVASQLNVGTRVTISLPLIKMIS